MQANGYRVPRGPHSVRLTPLHRTRPETSHQLQSTGVWGQSLSAPSGGRWQVGHPAARQAQLIDGNELSAGVLTSVGKRVQALPTEVTPCLVVVLVGDNKASMSYIAKKEQAAAKCGILARVSRLASR
jgi:hypothetical protein